MFHKLTQLLCVAMMCIAAIGCDDIIIPPDDDPTPPRDSNTVDTGIVIRGPIVSGNFDPTRGGGDVVIKESYQVVLAWMPMGAPAVVYGVGTIDATNFRYEIVVTGNLPADAMETEPNGSKKFGVGNIYIVDRATPFKNGDVWDLSTDPTPIVGTASWHGVVYRNGGESQLDGTQWLANFSQGYTLGQTAFIGYVPSQDQEVPVTLVQ